MAQGDELPGNAFRAARLGANQWIETISDQQRLAAACAFVDVVLAEYRSDVEERLGHSVATTAAPAESVSFKLDAVTRALAITIGHEASRLSLLNAAYWLSITYTALLPDSIRSRFGVYYTPPGLTDRLMQMAAEAGVDWKTCRVLDPACGGGAFLAPAALRMAASLRRQAPNDILRNVSNRLRGFEIDEFAAWMSQFFLEVALAPLCDSAGKKLPQLVRVGDSLTQEPSGKRFDLVIGNPPYGRITLSPELRTQYGRSLYGHANLYGVFTDLAVRWTAPEGVVAYVTPTSFLAGQYFKSLRSLLGREAPPVSIDIVASRRNVFENVQQETLLATYKKSAFNHRVRVHHLQVLSNGTAVIVHAGGFSLPDDPGEPWIVPRIPEHQRLVTRLSEMRARLADWGYGVSTGPLVWNRFKSQLRSSGDGGALPLVWAEAVSKNGEFVFRAEQRNHAPFFSLRAKDAWLRIDQPCVLLQRTTAKEQSRRLIAASLPASLIRKHGGVVVENHLNMVRPLNGHVSLPPATVAAFFNTKVVDQAFRCISGSVAVSAYELEALPLPSSDEMKRFDSLVQNGASPDAMERCLTNIYLGESK